MRRGAIRTILVAASLVCAAQSALAQDSELIGPLSPPSQGAGDPAVADRAEPASLESSPLGLPTEGAAPLGTSPRQRDEAASRSAPASPLRPGEGWWRSAGALAIVIALIVACGAGVRAWARRSGGLLRVTGPGGRAPAGLLQVLGRYPIGRGQTLLLLKLDRRVLLVSQGVGGRGGSMQTLSELTDPEDVASILMLTAEAEGRSLRARFRDMVGAFDSGYAEPQPGLAPVVIEHDAVRPAASPDPLGSLRSRLHSLRGDEPGGSA